MSDNTPSQIGDYEILREIGHGGMGKVYKARNLISDRVEAIKVVLPDLAGRSEFTTRFMREIKVLASLDHPNIAALRTAFTAGDQFVMVMEYVEGVTLADRLEQGPFSPADALNYIDQVLAALSYAHSKHVVHRDIKPGNMMLTPQGVVKLMDFGLARSSSDAGLTMTGTTVGSLDFMSPEQVKSEPTDERSDLYSVGASLYQMVTRQRMFRATSGYSIMEAHVKETPRPPIEIQPGVRKAVSDLIVMAVAKEPAQRFQTADAFRNAVAQIRASLPQETYQAATATAIGAYPQPEPAAAAPLRQPTPLPPPVNNAASAPSPVAPQPAPAQGGPGVLIAVAAVLVLALLAGAWAFYRSREHRATVTSGTGSGATSKPPEASSAPPATSVQEANPPVQPPAPPPDTTARDLKRPTHPNANTSPGLMPGGAAPDSQAEQQAELEHRKLLQSMERESDQLDSRAAAVESSLDGLEQQMHASGYGLRGDMVAARANMRNDMAKAKQALDGGDTDRARQFLDQAHREMEKLEAFLGHR